MKQPVSLPYCFLDALVTELDGPDLCGIMLGGSYVRGTATPYSDVDIACFVATDEKVKPKYFEYRNGLLVSIGTKSLAGARADMRRPERAIRVVPGLRECRVLLDKDGSLAVLMQDLKKFAWEHLQPAADRYASYQLMLSVEVAHKILSESLKKDDLAVSAATLALFSRLTDIVAVQRGVLVKSDNTYYSQVEESAGLDSVWTRFHRLSASAITMQTEGPVVMVRSALVLRLYAATLEAIRPCMLPEHLTVVEQTVRIIEQAREDGVILAGV